MKYDTRYEQQLAQSLARFSKKANTAGQAFESVGKNMMKTGCSMMILALIGFLLFAVIF